MYWFFFFSLQDVYNRHGVGSNERLNFGAYKAYKKKKNSKTQNTVNSSIFPGSSINSYEIDNRIEKLLRLRKS